MIRGGVAGCYTANLGPQPRGLARSYHSGQQPTTIVCVFVYGEICHSNPLCGGKECGRVDSACEGFHLKGIQHPNIKLHINKMISEKQKKMGVVKAPRFAVCVHFSFVH